MTIQKFPNILSPKLFSFHPLSPAFLIYHIIMFCSLVILSWQYLFLGNINYWIVRCKRRVVTINYLLFYQYICSTVVSSLPSSKWKCFKKIFSHPYTQSARSDLCPYREAGKMWFQSIYLLVTLLFTLIVSLEAVKRQLYNILNVNVSSNMFVRAKTISLAYTICV